MYCRTRSGKRYRTRWLMIYNSILKYMMTSSNGNIFRVTGHLYGEFIGHRWIPLTKASDAELWCFLCAITVMCQAVCAHVPVIYESYKLRLKRLKLIIFTKYFGCYLKGIASLKKTHCWIAMPDLVIMLLFKNTPCSVENELTYRGRDTMAYVFQTTFSNVFSRVKMCQFRLRFPWRFFPRVQLTILQHWFR